MPGPATCPSLRSDDIMRATRTWLRGMALGVAGTIGCSGCAAPTSSTRASAATGSTSATPTVLVVNPLCDGGGRCETVFIRANIPSWPIPSSLWGMKDLGRIDGPTGCFQFPAVWTATLSQVDSVGAVIYSDTLRWTLSSRQSVVLVASSEAVPGGLVGFSQSFAPADASGWELTYTKSSGHLAPPYTGHVAPAQPCEPG